MPERDPAPDKQQILLLAEVKTMSMLLNDRLGDNNPWAKIDFSELNFKELSSVRKMLHELLYAPPPRSR